MTELSNLFVCLMGMTTVFVSLVCIVFICLLTSAVVRGFAKKEKKTSAPANNSAAGEVSLSGEERDSVIAGVCACIAEELGTDASNIRVVSFKKV